MSFLAHARKQTLTVVILTVAYIAGALLSATAAHLPSSSAGEPQRQSSTVTCTGIAICPSSGSVNLAPEPATSSR